MVWRRIQRWLARDKGVAKEFQWLLTDKTQIEPQKVGQEPIQLVIGLDFGTSFTKIVVGESRKRYAVPFDDFALDKDKNPYLLPSVVSIVQVSEECTLGLHSNAIRTHDNLKMPLIDRDFSPEVKIRAVVFLALVLRYVRGWLFSAHQRTYMNRHIEWFVNVGLPTDSYDDNELTSIYLDIVRTAWHLSILPGPISFATALIQIQQPLNDLADRALPDDRINTFPEFVAQIAVYVRSPRRQEDLHAMIDVGSGTLDVTVFNVVKKKTEDLFPIFERAVRPLGTRYLLRHRFEILKSPDIITVSPFDDLPSNGHIAEQCGITVERLTELDQPFRKNIGKCVGNALRHTKQNRYPSSHNWKHGLPTFFCGGGAASEFYASFFNVYKQRPPPYRLRFSDLPYPEDLEASLLDGNIYSRLTVAYGLSFDPFDLGKIVRKGEIEDIVDDTQNRDYSDRMITKDMV